MLFTGINLFMFFKSKLLSNVIYFILLALLFGFWFNNQTIAKQQEYRQTTSDFFVWMSKQVNPTI